VCFAPSFTATARRRVRGVAAGWRADRQVVRLTSRVRDLLLAVGRRTTEATVAIGRHLAEIHARLQHGQWLEWLEDNPPFSRRTATGYIALAEWADASAADFARLGHVGPTKLMLLAAQPPAKIRGLKAGKPIDVPGIDRKKTIEAMTVADLDRVLGGLTTPAPRQIPITKVVQAVRFRAAGVRAAAEGLAMRAREVDPDDAEAIRKEVAAVMDVLDGAFG
jgi:hypothetical protein